MNSIFDTEEDFEFSDDDCMLNASLFSRPLEKEEQKKILSPKQKDPNFYLNSECSSSVSTKTSSITKCNEQINVIKHSHLKNFSTCKSKLKDKPDCDAFESDEIQVKIPRKSCMDINGRIVYKGFKFHSSSEEQRKHALESTGACQSDCSVKSAEREKEHLVSAKPVANIKNYQDHLDLQSSLSCGANFSAGTENENTKMKQRSLLNDQPLKESCNFGNKRFEILNCFNTDLEQQQSNAGKNIALNKQDVSSGMKDDINHNLQSDAKSPMISKKRKFPGPAGLLPSLNSIQNLDCINTPKHTASKRRSNTPKIFSPSKMIEKEDSDFHKPFWLELQRQALQKYKGLVYHSISRTLRKAHSNQLEKGKVPLMCALIKTFTLTGSDASVILKDPTGEIYGTVHKGVLESYQSGLSAGSGVILKQVSIFSPSSRKHYVNITPSNIMLLQQEDSSIVLPSQVIENPDSITSSMTTERGEAGKDASQHYVDESEEQDEDIDALFANDDFDSWIDDSDDFLSKLSDELPF